MIKFKKSMYSNLGGWSTEETEITEAEAIKLAASAQRGNANLSTSPEEWAMKKVQYGQNFRVYKTPEVLYEFVFV